MMGRREWLAQERQRGGRETRNRKSADMMPPMTMSIRAVSTTEGLPSRQKRKPPLLQERGKAEMRMKCNQRRRKGANPRIEDRSEVKRVLVALHCKVSEHETRLKIRMAYRSSYGIGIYGGHYIV